MNVKTLRKKLPEHLVSFLKKHKVLTKFVKHTCNVHDPRESWMIDYMHTKKAIIGAFYWTNTDEGHEFWENLHVIFMNLHKTHKDDSNRV